MYMIYLHAYFQKNFKLLKIIEYIIIVKLDKKFQK